MTNPDKWLGLPVYDRPPVAPGESTDDGRPTLWRTDFSRCLPASALGDAGGQWSVIDYATERFAGKLLHARRDNPAPDVELALDAPGWHAVFLWINGGDVDTEKQFPADFDSVFSQSPGPALRLSGDRRFASHFKTLTHDRVMWPGLECCFWKYADLTGQSLHVRHQGGTVYLGAVQLVPLAPAEVEAVRRVRGDASRRRLVVKGDMYSPREADAMVEQLRDRDVRAWIVGCEDSADLLRPGGSTKLASFGQACDEIAAACWVCDRPSLWSLHVHWPDARARWFEQHPELHVRDRDGTPTHQASFAEPAVQDYMLERAGAALATPGGIDAFGYFFNRDPGLLLFEPAATRGFQERHGVDPLTLPDRDERLLDWRAEIITGYMRRLRALLDTARPRSAAQKRVESVAVVLGDPAANRFFSFDVERWVREGLVDALLIYPWADYPDRWLAQGFVDADVKWFASVVKGTGVKVYPMWLSGTWRTHWTAEHVRPSEYFTCAMREYADGADGISAWDGVGLDAAFRSDRWLRLGQVDHLASWARHDFPLPPKLRFTRYAGATPDRYPVGTGG